MLSILPTSQQLQPSFINTLHCYTFVPQIYKVHKSLYSSNSYILTINILKQKNTMFDFDTNDKNKVDVHSTLTVVSTTPVKPGQVNKLSLLDRSMSQHSLHLIYYYRTNPDRHFDTDGLRISLSNVLSMYPPVMGRLMRDENDEWEINCNDAGVRVVKANVNVTLCEWLKSGDGCRERDLITWKDMPQDPTMWSPFRIQINDFVGGGVAIGLSCSHMLADLTFLATLFQAWTMSHRHQPIPHPPSFKGLQPLTTSTVKSDYEPKLNGYKEPGRSKIRTATATFSFSDSIIKQCLDEIHLHCANATPFDLLAAAFWKSVVEATKSESEEKYSLSMCVDFRKGLSEPLPLGYFGNALHFSNLSSTNEEMKGDNWLLNLTKLINLHSCRISEYMKIDSCSIFESKESVYGAELTCISTEHLIDKNTAKSVFYDATFEEGERPVHVSCHIGNSVAAEGNGLIVVMPSPDGGLSRTVMVTLPAEQLAKVQADGIFLNLKPKFIVNGGI